MSGSVMAELAVRAGLDAEVSPDMIAPAVGKRTDSITGADIQLGVFTGEFARRNLMPCLDADVIAELREILGEDLNAVASEFVDQFNELLVPLRASAEASTWPEVARLAHLLKGSAGNLGATALAAAFLALERAAQAGDGETVTRELIAVDGFGADCITELQALGLLEGKI
jgi:HPt (histidine-containing phosphotransfer) domain-containing protein